MREFFIEELIKEVLGPRDGPKEIMEENPAMEYLTGILIPKQSNQNLVEISLPEEEFTSDNGVIGPEEYAEDDNIATIIPSDLDPTQRARSFGISFVAMPDPVLDICITWARYIKTTDEKGKEVWERKPFYKIYNNISDFYELDGTEIIDENGEKPLKLFIKKSPLPNDKYNIVISLVNNMKSNEFLDCNHMVFQPSIRINFENGYLPPFPQDYGKEALEFVYRERKIKARGHMCSAIWDDVDYINQVGNDIIWPDGLYFLDENKDLGDFEEPNLRTEFIPMHPMPLPSFDIWDNELIDENLYDNYEDLLKAKNLSEIWDEEDIDRELSPLIEEYSKWHINQKSKAKGFRDNKEIIDEIIENQNKSIERMEDGLKILKEDKYARLSFCFANKAILTQDSWKKGNEDFKWRGFQIAFFLMNIESLIKKESDYRDVLDLLWISTGGGKTESYLAIMAFIISYRRLTNDNYAGTSIISRYTLRLLTIQQFSRTLSLITAAEYLRVMKSDGKIGWRPKKCDIDEDWLYGSLRFSLGMWVGSSVTPNRLLYTDLNDKNSALKILMNPPKEKSSNPAQVVKCPVCGNWLSVQETGIPKGDSFFIVVKSEEPIENFCERLKVYDFVEDVETFNEGHEKNYFTIKLIFNKIVKSEDLNVLMDSFKEVEIASLSVFNPGYFGINETKGQKISRYSDFNIFCTDPECKLNSDVFWKEGHPFTENTKLDYYYERILETPFNYSSRIPIPACTVDYQIYTQCPTVIIGTADKIARIAYEGNVATIFGNVSLYNKYYGYFKNENHIPNEALKTYRSYETVVDKFLPPDLIIQDELHLIDGPLGSLFGIYETILNLIIKENGGNPKYIASSATIKNAEMQSKLLFAKTLHQFPPYGLNAEDNFFVKERPLKEAWDENNSGRVYMGIYSPGRGPMTPQIQLWACMLNTSLNHIDEDYIKYYWTIVGYYNAIRELGGGIALFREDISERFKEISNQQLDTENLLELSSRLDSTKVPLELSKIEIDGKFNDIKQHPKLNAIFTTSMFGTGVDISHLSLMILNGQPKTTSSYIQASGRIGREHGGLVVNFLKAGRPRDLNHYEMFPSYHYKFQTSVEPVSVSPFSKGALDKAIGATIVSFLRNSVNMNFDWDEEPILEFDINAINDFNILKNNLRERLEFIFDGEDVNHDEKEIDQILDDFESSFNKFLECSKKDIEYYYTNTSRFEKHRKNVVLGDPFYEHSEDFEAIFNNAPNSLRDVEEATRFWV